MLKVEMGPVVPPAIVLIMLPVGVKVPEVCAAASKVGANKKVVRSE
jgi:hypothetical protein